MLPILLLLSATECPLEARCLMREVGRWARLGPERPVPAWIGRRTGISRARAARCLRARQLAAQALGGALGPLRRVRYFVLHDTSAPNYGASPFPTEIDTPAWPGNRLQRWRRGRRAPAHVFVNRTGRSVTARDFRLPLRATKRERAQPALRGRMLHVELVQPRRSDPRGPPGNDAVAPEPAFPEAQIVRAALLYVVASVRAGR